MSSNQDFVEYIIEQIEDIGNISYKKMFGEYAIYFGNKVVALICNDQLFIKQTEGGKDFIGEVNQAIAYPGAKMSFLIEDRLEDKEWLSQLIKITANELPEPKIKKKSIRRKKNVN